MSINTGTPNNNAGTQNPGRREARTNIGGGMGVDADLNTANNARPGFSFMNTLQLPVRSRNGSKHITDFLKNFDELKPEENVWKVGYVVLDNTQEVGWRFSTIAIVVHAVANPEVLAVYPMVLEHTISRPMEDVAVKSGDLEFRLTPVPSMAMDRDWDEAIINEVLSKFPTANAKSITMVAGMTVPKTQDLSDMAVVEKLVENACLACVTMLVEVLPGFEDVDLTALDQNVTPTVRLETTTFSERTDLLGRPVREDFRMTFSGRNANNEKQNRDPFQQNDAAAAEVPWGNLSVMMEPMYAPQAASSMVQLSNEPRTRVMAVRAVITDMTQFRMSSTASNLMMLLPVMALADRNVWMSLMYQRMKDFYNKYPDAEPNPTDLGMLNLVTGAFGNPSEAKGPAVLVDSNNDPTSFAEFMTASFKEDVYVAIDVPHAGPNSWFLSLFSGVANGDRQAMEELVRGADVLTGGMFSQEFFGGDLSNMKTSDFFVEVNSTLYAGQFPQRMPDGEVRMVDERTIDYTALQNKLGRTNPPIMQKFSQSWLTRDIPDPAHRLASRDEVMTAYAGKLEHYDFFERHTFNTEFLSALWNCAVRAGFAPELRYIDALRGASGGLSAPAFTVYKGLESGSLNTSFQRSGGLGASARRMSGFGTARPGGRWGGR